jgi:hypothetical protein
MTPTFAAGHYLSWGVVSISATNLAVIVLMVVLFALALLVPFPAERDHVAEQSSRDHEDQA